MTEREQRVRAVVARVAELEKLDVPAGEHLFDSGIISSFGLTDLIVALQEEFGVEVPDSELKPENFGSIQAIEAYLDRPRP